MRLYLSKAVMEPESPLLLSGSLHGVMPENTAPDCMIAKYNCACNWCISQPISMTSTSASLVIGNQSHNWGYQIRWSAVHNGPVGSTHDPLGSMKKQLYMPFPVKAHMYLESVML